MYEIHSWQMPVEYKVVEDPKPDDYQVMLTYSTDTTSADEDEGVEFLWQLPEDCPTEGLFKKWRAIDSGIFNEWGFVEELSIFAAEVYTISDHAPYMPMVNHKMTAYHFYFIGGDAGPSNLMIVKNDECPEDAKLLEMLSWLLTEEASKWQIANTAVTDFATLKRLS